MNTSGFEVVFEVLRCVGPDAGAPSAEHSSEFDLHREAQAVPETEMPPSPRQWCDVCAAAYRLTSTRTEVTESTCACTQLPALTAMVQRAYVMPSMYPHPFFDDNSLHATGIAGYSL